MDRHALLDHLAQEMDHWPAPGSLPEPPIKGTWTCHGQWRCYAKGNNRPIEKNDWTRRRLALLSQFDKGEASKMSTTPNAPRWPEGYDQNGFRLNYGLTHQQRADALDTGICADGVRCGFGTPEHGPVYCDDCPNRPQPEPSTIEAAIDQPVNATVDDTEELGPRHSAPWFLQRGLAHMEDRAKTYDKQGVGGERSMQATVNAFVAITGDGQIDTAERGWMFMVLLKMTRSQQGQFKADNYEDAAAYCGLMGESAAAERGA